MIKVSDIAYVRFAVPDLSAMDAFARDFGFVPAERNERALYSRGTDPSPYIHIAELDANGEAGFRGVAFEAASMMEGDLELARIEVDEDISIPRRALCALMERFDIADDDLEFKARFAAAAALQLG